MLKFFYILAKDFVHLFLRLILWGFIIFGLAMLTRFFWSDSFALYFNTVDIYKLSIIRFAALGFCGFMSAFILAVSVFVPATWFAQNLFSQEGTLTFSLPVYPWVHVLSKIISAFAMNVILMIAIVFSVFAFKDGIEYFDDIISAINDVTSADNVNVWAVAEKGIWCILTVCFFFTALCYLSLSLGQLVSSFRNLFIFFGFCVFLVLGAVILAVFAIQNNVMDITVMNSMQGVVDFSNNILKTN